MVLRPPKDLRALSDQLVNDGIYQIIDYRGSGRRGHVFCAQRDDGRKRALKFVEMSKLTRTHGWEQECFKAHQLEHQPNTVRFYEFFLHEKYAVMVFDYVEGKSLKERIATRELTVSDIQRVLENLLFFRRDCLTLENDLRHGDLHPGNIILREPIMGPPRPYEVMITDFGIGYTGAVLQPKEDLFQIGLILTRMLQAITREHIGQEDRVFYDELCSGATVKRLREASPLERGEEKTIIQDVIEELASIRADALAPESSTVHTRFGDYLVGEQLGNRWKEWRELFVPTFPGYEDIVSQNITVLTGTRGCGKTMVFRRLSALLSFEVGPVDDGAAGALVGFYLNMNNIADAFLFNRSKALTKNLAMRVIQFFHLSLLSEIIHVADVARQKAPTNQKDVYDKANRWLFDTVVELFEPATLYPGPGADMRVALALLDHAKNIIRESTKPPKHLMTLAQNDWLKRFMPDLQAKMPWICGRPTYFFLDDYSLPKVNEHLQKVLNSVIFQRADCFFFKISTESPSTLYRIDYSNKILDEPDDFELTDLGSVTIDLLEEERSGFLDEIFRRRFVRDYRFQDKSLSEVLGPFKMSWVELARKIRKEADITPSANKSTSSTKGGILYHGRNVFLNMWSGDTRYMVKILQKLLEQLPTNNTPELPLDPKLQNKVFRNTGGEFLHLLKACMRTCRQGGPNLPSHITSWGEHLVKIAEAFKEIALHELRNRQGGRKGRNEPKQAFRIEIIDKFSLKGTEKEIYEDLVRYGVFLRDDRGKSIRGAIIPRLYLRRLLIPYCTLTFSKIDNIAMNSSAFKRLIIWPEEFLKSWQKDRLSLVTQQREFKFE